MGTQVSGTGITIALERRGARNRKMRMVGEMSDKKQLRRRGESLVLVRGEKKGEEEGGVVSLVVFTSGEGERRKDTLTPPPSQKCLPCLLHQP